MNHVVDFIPSVFFFLFFFPFLFLKTVLGQIFKTDTCRCHIAEIGRIPV